MAGGGGKGGSTETSVEIPEWLEKASRDAINRGERIGDIGYTPYMGPEVAAFNQAQEASFNNNAAMAADLGLQAPAGSSMPAAQDFGGGVMGYGSSGLYDSNMARLREARPGQVDYIDSFFIDPVTGGVGLNTNRRIIEDRVAAENQILAGYGASPRDEDDSGNEILRDVTGRGSDDRGGSLGGYTSFDDMFDGGGPGASGGSFRGGGLLSSAANTVSGRGRSRNRR